MSCSLRGKLRAGDVQDVMTSACALRPSMAPRLKVGRARTGCGLQLFRV